MAPHASGGRARGAGKADGRKQSGSFAGTLVQSITSPVLFAPMPLEGLDGLDFAPTRPSAPHSGLQPRGDRRGGRRRLLKSRRKTKRQVWLKTEACDRGIGDPTEGRGGSAGDTPESPAHGASCSCQQMAHWTAGWPVCGTGRTSSRTLLRHPCCASLLLASLVAAARSHALERTGEQAGRAARVAQKETKPLDSLDFSLSAQCSLSGDSI